MLDPWIIEEIIRREREEQRRQDERRIELPLQQPPRYDSDSTAPSPPPEDKDRGVTGIDI